MAQFNLRDSDLIRKKSREALISKTLVLVIESKKIRNKNSERFARNPALLARSQTFG
jgi:hypothetical protein